MTDKYIPTNGNMRTNDVFHLNEECTLLKAEPRKVTENEIAYHDMEICSWCDPDSDEPNGQSEQDRGYYFALLNEAKK